MIDGWGVSCEIALIWMLLDLTYEKSTLVQVMAWCRQATSHYLSQCWPRSLSPHGVTRPQWVNILTLYRYISTIVSSQFILSVSHIIYTDSVLTVTNISFKHYIVAWNGLYHLNYFCEDQRIGDSIHLHITITVSASDSINFKEAIAN